MARNRTIQKTMAAFEDLDVAPIPDNVDIDTDPSELDDETIDMMEDDYSEELGGSDGDLADDITDIDDDIDAVTALEALKATFKDRSISLEELPTIKTSAIALARVPDEVYVAIESANSQEEIMVAIENAQVEHVGSAVAKVEGITARIGHHLGILRNMLYLNRLRINRIQKKVNALPEGTKVDLTLPASNKYMYGDPPTLPNTASEYVSNLSKTLQAVATAMDAGKELASANIFGSLKNALASMTVVKYNSRWETQYSGLMKFADRIASVPGMKKTTKNGIDVYVSPQMLNSTKLVLAVGDRHPNVKSRKEAKAAIAAFQFGVLHSASTSGVKTVTLKNFTKKDALDVLKIIDDNLKSIQNKLSFGQKLGLNEASKITYGGAGPTGALIRLILGEVLTLVDLQRNISWAIVTSISWTHSEIRYMGSRGLWVANNLANLAPKA